MLNSKLNLRNCPYQKEVRSSSHILDMRLWLPGARHRTCRFYANNCILKPCKGEVVMYMETQMFRLWDALVVGLPVECSPFFS